MLLLALLVGGISESTRPAVRAPGVPFGPIHLTGAGLFQQVGDGPIRLCHGPMALAWDVRCGSSVEVVGLQWRQIFMVRHYESGLTEGVARWTGIWSHGRLTVRSVSRIDVVLEAPPTIPPPSPVRLRPELCSEPVGDPRTDSSLPDAATLASIPGYQLSWTTSRRSGPPDGRTVLHLVVSDDAPAATEAVRRHYGGLLCVIAARPPTTEQSLDTANRVLMALYGGQRPEVALHGVGWGGLADGFPAVEIGVFVVTPAVLAEVEQLVGPDMAPWTVVVGDIGIGA